MRVGRGALSENAAYGAMLPTGFSYLGQLPRGAFARHWPTSGYLYS